MADTLDFQRTVAQFVREHGLEAPVQARLLDLVPEVGELAKEGLEDVGLQTALNEALEKYRERLAFGDDAGSGR